MRNREILYGTLIDLAFPVGTPTFLTATSDTTMVINVVVVHSPVSRNVRKTLVGSVFQKINNKIKILSLK